MRVLINWLPSSLAASAAVAGLVERAGFWGLGVTDSPRACELYTTIATCRAATTTIAVGPCVTNPVTRHRSIHAAAMRSLEAVAPGRAFFGIGTGDSAVRAVGLRPGAADELAETVEAVRDATSGALSAFVAAAGPRSAAAAGRVGGLLAGCGRDLDALETLAEMADGARTDGHLVERWVSLRFAVGDDADEIAALRRAFLPRALSAARFNLHPSAGVPDELLDVLRTRFAAYDFRHHGTTSANPNGRLFADRPDVEEWALDRYTLIGDVDRCAAELDALATAGVSGCFLSIQFEAARQQVERAGRVLRVAGLADPTLQECRT